MEENKNKAAEDGKYINWYDEEDILGRGTKKIKNEENEIYGRAKDVLEMDIL
jgi:hypothetical protein